MRGRGGSGSILGSTVKRTGERSVARSARWRSEARRACVGGPTKRTLARRGSISTANRPSVWASMRRLRLTSHASERSGTSRTRPSPPGRSTERYASPGSRCTVSRELASGSALRTGAAAPGPTSRRSSRSPWRERPSPFESSAGEASLQFLLRGESSGPELMRSKSPSGRCQISGLLRDCTGWPEDEMAGCTPGHRLGSLPGQRLRPPSTGFVNAFRVRGCAILENCVRCIQQSSARHDVAEVTDRGALLGVSSTSGANGMPPAGLAATMGPIQVPSGPWPATCSRRGSGMMTHRQRGLRRGYCAEPGC